jgi:hypothetical protein
MTRLTPYDSSISTRLREMWSCICKLQEQIGSDTPPAPATPTNTVGLAAKPGVATTYMRSDGAPALDQTINPTWTGIHTFGANPLIKNVLPNIQFQNSSNTQLGFINFGNGTPGIPAEYQVLTSDQFRITVGVAAAATYTFGNAGQLGVGNPVAFGTAGQVLTSGGPTGALSWTTPASIPGAIVNQATSTILTSAQSGSIITNQGAAAAVTYTLPAATVGLMYEFVNTVGATTSAITVRAVGTDTIRNTTESAAAGAVQSGSAASGDSIKVICNTAGKWMVMYDGAGDWSVIA